MKTAISLTDTTFQRVESAARRLGVSRSEFFARAAERWLNDLDDDQTTAAIDRAIAETSTDTSSRMPRRPRWLSLIACDHARGTVVG
jgi:metal-responsive CopG/Arc/MetJ family transcriptional regulator